MGKKKRIVDNEEEDYVPEGGEATGQEDTKEQRDEDRAARRAQKTKALQDADALHLGLKELEDKQRKDAEREEEAPTQGFGSWLLGIVLQRRRRPPPVWKMHRRKEIEKFLFMMNKGPLGGHDSMWYRLKVRKKIKYYGDLDPLGLREGRGVCYWPDPPWGGGESYFGLWREDQPNAHGVFRWYDGDVYLGDWALGKMQGYGIYTYSYRGPTPRDRYEGGYFQSVRQGTGVYSYAGKEGGVYLGEWLRGKMNGQGMMLYPDGEYYMGTWKFDKKDGYGVYVWGRNAGEVAGDKYEGNFKDGYVHGAGKTVFSDGGWHKGRYMHGKMSGWGMMLTADGWAYIGSWKEDELHGPCVCYFSYGAIESKKSVQEYDMGELIGEREYDKHEDWGTVEALGRAEAKLGEEESVKGLNETKRTQVYVKRAKVSQQLARDSADEAKAMCRAAQMHQEELTKWLGLKHRINPD